MDDILFWAFGASWAGIAWSIVTFLVAEARGQHEEMKKFAAALFGTLGLSTVILLIMIFAGATGDEQDTAAVGGIVIGIVSGVFTAFSVMGGKPPVSPPG